jgi:hypothetical protein
MITRIKLFFCFVTTDSFAKANAFLVKENLNLPIYQSETNAARIESTTIPATYPIDKHGNVVVAKNWYQIGIVIRSGKT